MDKRSLLWKEKKRGKGNKNNTTLIIDKIKKSPSTFESSKRLAKGTKYTQVQKYPHNRILNPGPESPK